MSKYLQVFKISFAQEFAYRINFIMWRVRNILQFFLIFFLWDSVYSQGSSVIFGYDKTKILTYVFGLLIVRAFVLSARTVDVGGEVASGDLSNYLLKPISYFKYWLTRDVSSKALNLIFAAVEIIILYFILRPPFFIQTDPGLLAAFFLTLVLAMFIYFNILFITSAIPLWIPEAAWGSQFLITIVFVEFLSGGIFPLDILPQTFQQIINLTPFPYLIFFPLQVYLGKITGGELFRGLLISIFWAGALWIWMNSLWKKGLKVYQAQGR